MFGVESTRYPKGQRSNVAERAGWRFPRGVQAVAAVTLALAVAWLTACGGQTPTAPAASSSPRSGSASTAAGVGSQNQPPTLILKTTPVADKTGLVWIVTGVAPLSVTLNLCNSTDPSHVIGPDGILQGDELNWQFNFGDPPNYTIRFDGTPTPDPAFGPDGLFRPDFDHFCRVTYTYRNVGTYVATVSVTDKHLEDQSNEVRALGRTTQRVKIEAVPEPPKPSPTPVAAAPVISAFTATAGCSPWTLAWTTSGATSASIDSGVGAVPVNGSVNVAAAGTYTLTATGPGGTATSAVTVVACAAPVILTFTESWGCLPTAGWTLVWTTSGATSASIDNAVGAVPVNGSRFLGNPAFPAGAYTLTAIGPGGTTTGTILLVAGGC